MAAMAAILPYITAATAVNSLYGAVTGTPGGLIGEIFGTDEPAKPAAPAPTPPAPAPAAKVEEPVAAPAPVVAPVVAAPVAPISPISPVPALETLLAPAAVAPAVTPAVTLEKPPEVTKPTVMPSTNDAAVKAAKAASIAEQLRRRGRASTILTDGGTYDPLG